MVRFRKEVLDEITERIVQLGLEQCPVCSSPNSMAASRRPVVLSIGGLVWEDPSTRNADANVVFAVPIRKTP